MGPLGEDLQTWSRPMLYQAASGVSPWRGVVFALLLFIAYLVIQLLFSLLFGAVLFGSLVDERAMIKAAIISALPAALVTAGLAWLLSGTGGANRLEVLALRQPRLTWLGWLAVVVAFLLGMYLFVVVITFLFGIDPVQYTPGPDGSSPESGSAGLVKEAMYSLTQNPFHYSLAFLSVSIGAPLAEELVFRGQLFSSLVRTRLGRSGTVLVTTLLWALMHFTEPWLAVGIIFVMGLVLGWLLLRFGSILITMVCHGAWNAVYSLIIYGSLAS